MVLWVVPHDRPGFSLRELEGRKRRVASALVEALDAYFQRNVDVQTGGSCYLPYVDGYVTKESDSMDFSLKEHAAGEPGHRWRMCYRALCKSAAAIPEMYVHMAGLALVQRSFRIDNVFAFAPVYPGDRVVGGRRAVALHDAYVRAFQEGAVMQSFQQWLREHTVTWSGDGYAVRERGFDAKKPRVCVVVRFAFELYDVFLGQFCLAQFPHRSATVLLPVQGEEVLDFTRHFLGAR
eukprot:15467532-Alexandrium_andersonii.AAC.1